MNRKAWSAVLAIVMVLSAIVVFAQDGPGVVKITLPDGAEVPVFTDGRINAFDIGAPVVIYYTAQNGTVLNPFFSERSTGEQNPVDMDFAFTDPAVDTFVNPGSILDSVQLLAVDPVTSNGNLVMEASVDDLRSLVTGGNNRITENGYTLNYNREANWFWVSTPANFEGKVYTFAWENNLFPRPTSADLMGQAQPTAEVMAQPTTEVTAQATSQPTAQPTTQPTTTPSA